jgi:predicted MFS family arabinose efflux permease
MNEKTPIETATAPQTLSTGMTLVFAAACGFAVANIYYSQPLIGLIAPELGLQMGLAGLIMTLTQLGYGAGLLLVVPLADVVENRRLVAIALGGAMLALVGITTAASVAVFLLASFAVGVCAVATQVLVPFATHLAPEATRGKVVGNVMAGLLAGIMLARPFASFVAETFGWRSVFATSALAMLILIVVLLRLLPQRQPKTTMHYGNILASLPGLVVATPLLRRRAFYQGMMFAAFNVFWTGAPLLLMQAFGLSQNGIALFALAGAAGALAAPWAGYLADRGKTRRATGWAMTAVIAAFALAALASGYRSITLLVIGALLLDGAVQICQVLSLRSIYMLQPELRGRLNGLFMTFVFVCGAIASGLAAAVYSLAGWIALSVLGASFAVLALLAYATEFRHSR